ncbi:MAG: ribonuclease P protein component [Bacillota bacterium]|nr:ribonuclease P protein component [Thermoanaerobacteraceae bacterium]
MRCCRLGRRRFEEVFRRGRGAAAGGVVVLALPNQLPVYRVGFAVSRQVGSAVRRNRVRRVLREVSRHHPEWFQPGYDYVLLGRKAVGEEGYGAVARAVRQALGRLRRDREK